MRIANPIKALTGHVYMLIDDSSTTLRDRWPGLIKMRVARMGRFSDVAVHVSAIIKITRQVG